MQIIRKSDVDLVVFPEFCFIPNIKVFDDIDIDNPDDVDTIFDISLDLSKSIGKAVVINGEESRGGICSIFANAFAHEAETQCVFYIKHTMTKSSLLEFSNYQSLVKDGFFEPILLKGFKIGMTICYDCNHAIFSRMYELCGGVDVIVNSTGGDVVYDKWFKYNKVRAIENSCYNFVTMGGYENSKNYVLGFNPNGGMIKPVNLNGSSDYNNISGGIYVYEVTNDCGVGENDGNQVETINKNWQLEFPVGNTQAVIKSAEKVTDNIFKLSVENNNVILCMVDGMDILKPERVLPLLYAKEKKSIRTVGIS
jgi:predicted amidohydrolase